MAEPLVAGVLRTAKAVRVIVTPLTSTLRNSKRKMFNRVIRIQRKSKYHSKSSSFTRNTYKNNYYFLFIQFHQLIKLTNTGDCFVMSTAGVHDNKTKIQRFNASTRPLIKNFPWSVRCFETAELQTMEKKYFISF